jgi:uncharacterized damage-inducible protein DinB
MKRTRTRTRLTPVAIAALTLIGAAEAARGQDAMTPESGVRAELVRDMDVLAEKYVSLARAMTAHYAWRPAEGVRSVSEVFTHVGGTNVYIPTAFGVAPPAGMEVASFDEAFARMQEMEGITDPAEVVETLEAGLEHARTAISSVPESELDQRVQIFGQDMSKREGLILLVTHMHEHLGQAVAYARMNGVVPPWSGGD